VVSSSEDPITTTVTDPGVLVTNEKRVCLRNLHTVNNRSPRREMHLVPFEFHNARGIDDIIDIVIEPLHMERGVVALLLPELDLVSPDDAFVGVTDYRLRPGERIGKWYGLTDDRTAELRQELLEHLDTSVLWEFDAGKRSEIRGIRVGAGQALQAVIVCKPSSRIPFGTAQRFTILQRQGGHVVGGSTYEIRVPTARTSLPVSRIRVLLNQLEVIHDHDPCLQGRGELSIAASVRFNESPTRVHRTRVPPEGIQKMGDRSGYNLYRLDVCLFDGFVTATDNMTIELAPVEHDILTPDDALAVYRRTFSFPPELWPGTYSRDDEGSKDQERLHDWRVWYRIESLPI
jgi:hypothetical protein